MLGDSISRYVGGCSCLVIMFCFVYRDGQCVESNTLGGVISNLHHPEDWSIFEQLPSDSRVHYAIGCHPKQAALLTAPLLKRLEEIVRRPGVIAVGECGLDYSAR